MEAQLLVFFLRVTQAPPLRRKRRGEIENVSVSYDAIVS